MSDYLSKNEDIKNLLIPTMDQIKKKEEDNSQKMMPKNLNHSFAISAKLNELLRKYPVLRYNEALSLSVEEYTDRFNGFMSLISWVNENAEFAPSKQLFCAYAEIPVSAYDYLLFAQDPDVQPLFESVESYLVDLRFAAAEAGNIKEKTAATRLKTKGIQGHNIQETKGNDTIINYNTAILQSGDDYIKKLTGGVPKLSLGGGKRKNE